MNAVRLVAIAASASVAIACFCLGETCVAEPIVIGFERFFATQPPTIEGGRLLLTELSCTACHIDQNDRQAASNSMPKRGPVLNGAGNRLSADWLRRFLDDPNSMKAGSTMPRMFAGLDEATRRQQIEAVVQFLMSKRDPLWQPATVGDQHEVIDLLASSFQRGFQLYHQVGCVACHDPAESFSDFHDQTSAVKSAENADGNDSKNENGAENGNDDDGDESKFDEAVDSIVPSVPHGRLTDKYTHESLANFLHRPLTGRPSGRMPDLKLSVLEAADIAHYLLNGRKQRDPSTFVTNENLVTQGKAIFENVGCANCHEITNVNAKFEAEPFQLVSANSSVGCLSDQANRPVSYALSNSQRNALQLAISAIEKPQSKQQILVHTMMKLNCFACHERQEAGQTVIGGVGSRRWDFFRTDGNVDFGDEGRIPPALTRVGSKLTESCLERVLAGAGDVRPHMLARMPKFGVQNVEHLPSVFADVDRSLVNSDSEKHVPDNETNMDAGRQLVNQSCLQCHSINGRKLTGVVGVDLSDLQNRLHQSWFREFLMQPEKVKRRTRMPTLFTNGKSVVADILDGDPNRQISAMWSYLKSTKDLQLPEKLTSDESKSFELVPKDKPILLRTFMREAGTHAVAVGFPQRIHFAVDAEKVRLAIAWKGRFLDAHGTWFDRFTPPAEPLGNERMVFPSGVPLVKLRDPNAKWPTETGEQAGYRWHGFRLDDQGVPTFLYQFEKAKVAERVWPNSDGNALRRTLEIEGQSDNLWLLLTTEESRADGMQVRVIRPNATSVNVHKTTRLPVELKNGTANIEVEYQW